MRCWQMATQNGSYIKFHKPKQSPQQSVTAAAEDFKN